MRREDRKHEIFELLVERGTVSLDEFAARFAVSKMTVHRDLDVLEGQGLLRKIRGGATIEASGEFESDFRCRSRIAAEEKRHIARAAAAFVEPGTSVMVGDGSTSQCLAPFLIERRPLTVITNNLALITGLTGMAGIELVSLGGSYSTRFNGFFGVLTKKALAGLRADTALLSSSAIEGRTAFHQDQEVLEVKKRMIASSARAYLMADHRKFGRTALYMLADLDRFEAVITTRALDPGAAETLRAGGITLRYAQEDEG